MGWPTHGGMKSGSEMLLQGDGISLFPGLKALGLPGNVACHRCCWSATASGWASGTWIMGLARRWAPRDVQSTVSDTACLRLLLLARGHRAAPFA
jgi:hypothetical protein